MIKIGAGNTDIIDSYSKVVELREHPDHTGGKFKNNLDLAYRAGQDIIFNIDNWKRNNFTIEQWQNVTDAWCYYCRLKGYSNSRLRFTIFNEPLEHNNVDVVTYKIKPMADIIHNYGFRVGAGNEQHDLDIGNRFTRKLHERVHLDFVDFHLQGAGLSPLPRNVITNLCNYYKGIANEYSGTPCCTEGNCYDVAEQEGYNLFVHQINECERIGCPHYTFVWFYKNANFDSKPNYKKLIFVYNGNIRSPYFMDFVKLINEKATIPIGDDDDMKLKLLKKGGKGNQVKFVQEILEVEYGFENTDGYDGILGSITEQQIKEYQDANSLIADGIIGKNTMSDLINKAGGVFPPRYWHTKLIIFMAYEG